MPNFVLGRTGAAPIVTVPIFVSLVDTLGQPVSGAQCTFTSSTGGSISFTLNGLGQFTNPGLTTSQGIVTVTATANGFTNGPWVATAVVGADGVQIRFDSWTPVPIRQAASTSRKDFGVYKTGVSAGTRDKFLWPFAANSAWNTPIGANAIYAPASYAFNSNRGYMTRVITEEEYLFLDPSSPLTTIRYSTAEWTGADRCPPSGSSGQFPISVRMPSTYTIPSDGGNNVAAHVDGDIVKHHQPICRCTPGADGTSFVTFADVNIKTSTGENGGHGGSNLSGLGGTIRYGEITNAKLNGLGYMSHALKMNWDATYYYYWGGGGSGNSYRWPATTNDGYANGSTYGGSNNQVKPGSLIALLPTFNVSGLITELARIIAGTLVRFGAYLTDDTTWNACAMSLEKGPAGNVNDEVFSLYGLTWREEPDIPYDRTGWYKDWEVMAAAFQVITNNSAVNVGGGGSPILGTQTAPAFGN